LSKFNLNDIHSKKNLIVIIGPTAVGKTAISIEIAKSLNTEIISADSRQFYKELKIGTAAPTKEELQTVKHHFIGTLAITDYYSAYKYQEEVKELLSTLFHHHKHIVLTGGSGLYIDAVCNGIDEIPDPDQGIRQDVISIFETQGIEALRQRLKLVDPEYYNKVDLANPKRLIRALEICMQTGQTYSSLRKKQNKHRDFNIIKIGLTREREELYERINERVDAMIVNGMMEEVEKMYPYKNLNALNSVGYKELFDYLDGTLSLDEAINKIKVNTRRYAKKQLTWFGKDKEIRWFHPEEKDKIIEYICSTEK